MNLYEFEGKQFFAKHGIEAPKGFQVRRGEDFKKKYQESGLSEVVVKAQVLSGKRGKNNAIKFCASADEVESAVKDLFNIEMRGQYVAAVRIEEKLDIVEEHYLSITYDTNARQPILVYSAAGGADIEGVPEEKIEKVMLDIRDTTVNAIKEGKLVISNWKLGIEAKIVQQLWECFLQEDCRLVEINPLVKTKDGRWVAADAKVAIDDDAIFRHEEWKELAPRTMMGRPPTEREIEAQKIDAVEKYYQGTAGKYIEMEGDIAILFSGGGASIANMDALIQQGLKPANYTEYSGNPPREKVYVLTKIVLSKPGLKGLWICGGVANFTNILETFNGIVDALDEIKPAYPIVVRRAGPFEKEGMESMRECGARNNLNMKLFGKEVSMSETAGVLAGLVRSQ